MKVKPDSTTLKVHYSPWSLCVRKMNHSTKRRRKKIYIIIQGLGNTTAHTDGTQNVACNLEKSHSELRNAVSVLT